MLLDFDGLMGNGVRLQPFPRSGVAATMPDLLFLRFALQSDSQKSFDFRLSLFALQSFQNIGIRVVIKL
jgi:hypothetical protein